MNETFQKFKKPKRQTDFNSIEIETFVQLNPNKTRFEDLEQLTITMDRRELD